MNVSVSLCASFSLGDLLSCFRNRKRRQNKPNPLVKILIDDINRRISHPSFDKKYVSHHLLNKLIQMTASEYGIISKVEQDGLHVYAITNIAWDSSSYDFYNRFALQGDTLIFSNQQSLFGTISSSKNPAIVNEYNEKRNILPHGHPPIQRFMGVPIVINGKTYVVVGLCNKITPYTKQDVKNVQGVMNTLLYLFV
jgi:GAF domain-containing protein